MNPSNGQALWSSVTDHFQLTESELVILKHAASVADHIAALDAIVENEGIMQATRAGSERVHPALAESRQQRLALVRLLGQLKVTADSSEPSER
jgi:hypothetical protein